MAAKRQTSFISAGLAIAAFCLPLAAGATEISTNTAQMQAMDKITGLVSVIDVPVGGEVKFGSFSILVRDCKTRSPEETPENFAFVDVADTELDNTQFNIFKGWMISSSPALNAVEHPIYDIWLLKCLNKPLEGVKLLSGEELMLRDKLPKYTQKQPDEKKPLPIEEKTDVVVGAGLNPAVVEGEIVLDNDVVPAVETITIDATDPTEGDPSAVPGVPSSLITIPAQTSEAASPEAPAMPDIVEAVEDASAMDADDTPIEVISIDTNEEARLKALEEARAAEEAAAAAANASAETSAEPVIEREILIGDYDEETDAETGN